MIERNYTYDIMRILACLMIICIHAPMPTGGFSYFNLPLSYLTAPGLCLFFVISGALLLPVKTDTKLFLRKRMGKVVMPTFFFSILYLFLNSISGSDVNWVKSLCSILFSAQGHGILWFMYTLIGLYLISPIISAWLSNSSKREEEFYLLLWAITMCYPVLKFFFDVNQTYTGVLYYFSGYIGYFILGHYLKKYPNSITLKKLVLPVIICIASPIICKLMNVKVESYSTFWYLSIFVAILTVSYYVFISKCSQSLLNLAGNKTKSFLKLTSNLSFGIYLLHMAIMQRGIWKLDFIININNYIIQWAIIVILTYIISWILAYLISLLPFGAYIIGFKRMISTTTSTK